MNTPTVYTLRQLIYSKYGEERFALGCEIVSRWLTTNKEPWTHEMVLNMCNSTAPGDFSISQSEGEKLRQLFGLKSVEDLFKQ